jgi:hypothetical protein
MRFLSLLFLEEQASHLISQSQHLSPVYLKTVCNYDIDDLPNVLICIRLDQSESPLLTREQHLLSRLIRIVSDLVPPSKNVKRIPNVQVLRRQLLILYPLESLLLRLHVYDFNGMIVGIVYQAEGLLYASKFIEPLHDESNAILCRWLRHYSFELYNLLLT